MKHGGEASKSVGVGLDAIEEFLRRDIVLEGKRKEISPFLILAEAIGDDDLVDSSLVEGMDEGAADETSRAGDENSGLGVEEGIGRVEFFFAMVARQGGAKRARGGFEGWVVFGHK